MSIARSGASPLVLCEYGTMTTTIWVLVSTYLPMLLHSIPLCPIPLMRPVYEQPVVTRAIDNNCSVLNSTPSHTPSQPFCLSLFQTRIRTKIHACAHIHIRIHIYTYIKPAATFLSFAAYFLNVSCNLIK